MTREELLLFAESVARRRSPQNFSDLLEDWQHTSFRLETKDRYLVPEEEEALAAFREGRPQPPPSADELAWLRGLEEETRAGKRRSRIHVVSQPLSEYLRWELVAYRDNAKVGEEIMIAERKDNPELKELTDDFYLFDEGTRNSHVVLIHYDEEGRPLAAWRTDDPEQLELCRVAKERASKAAIPLEEYIESVGLAEHLTKSG